MLEDSKKENQSGTGLGLFICKNFSKNLTYFNDENKGLYAESKFG